ncbi:MAG: ABC transporter ATP-binding protein [Acholeplasmataceae bacterium]|nr:ABC transporter ATP-binding protein [Acholeplasmataceae bacterium]
MIVTKGLTKDYGNHRGIFDVSFSISGDSCVGFLGPNGAGKTTTIRHLLGFIQNFEGEAYINNLNCKKDQVEIQKYVGYLPGEINFIDDLNGDELITLIARMKGVNDLSYANHLLERFELKATSPIKKMSKGMKQKLAIVIAFMNDPEILILDEPSSGLDPLMQQKLVDLILEHKKRGKTIFLSSHSFEEVEKTCDRIIMIKNGSIVNDSHVDQLKKEQIRKYEIEFIKESEAKDFAQYYRITHQDGLSLTIDLQDTFDSLLKKLAQYEIQDITQKDLSLEEIFMKYYGD